MVHAPHNAAMPIRHGAWKKHAQYHATATDAATAWQDY